MANRARRLISAFLLACALSAVLVIFAPPDWCEADWVKDNAFWRWYFNCDGDKE